MTTKRIRQKVIEHLQVRQIGPAPERDGRSRESGCNRALGRGPVGLAPAADGDRRDKLARHLDSGGTLNAMIVDVLGGGTDHYFDVFIEYELIDRPAGPSGWLERALVKARGSAAAVRRGFRRD